MFFNFKTTTEIKEQILGRPTTVHLNPTQSESHNKDSLPTRGNNVSQTRDETDGEHWVARRGRIQCNEWRLALGTPSSIPRQRDSKSEESINKHLKPALLHNQNLTISAHPLKLIPQWHSQTRKSIRHCSNTGGTIRKIHSHLLNTHISKITALLSAFYTTNQLP